MKCKVCGKEITQKRFYLYCSKQCRDRFHNQKNKEKNAIWQREYQDAKASKPDPKKVKCLICGRYYTQVGSHIYLRHGITAREYREQFDLEVKRGITPPWYREMKGEQAIENGTYKNLKSGMKYRFKKGSKTAGKYKRSHITLERLKKIIKNK
jgi:predicted transcriptional regulator